MGFNESLISKLAKIQVNIDENVANKFKVYMNLLLEWNNKINLTAIVEEEDIILKHFVDSLTVIKYIGRGEKIIDIGTGAGFPGIPIGIVNSDSKITLMDSLNKRIIFLDNVINELNLKNTRTIHDRAEELARKKEHREVYDIVVSRAVANLGTLVEYMLPFTRVGGKCICMKGANIQDELEEAKNAIKELGGEVTIVNNFRLPETDYERNIIVIEKVKNTKEKYPRRPGIPSKEPIR